MLLQALSLAALISLTSIIGVLLFGDNKRLSGIERYVVPVAAGVFLSLVINELIPEVMVSSPSWGGLIIMSGFLGFYILSHNLHKKYHSLESDDCDRKGAATLVLIGDGVHNFTDGIVLGGAFMVDPAIGVTTAIALAVHEVPQEIVEFGVLIRAGYTKWKAALLNLMSASTIILGVFVVFILSEKFAEYLWVLMGIAAGNLLYLAATDLIPRIHGNLSHYGNIWYSVLSILIGFSFMTAVLVGATDFYLG